MISSQVYYITKKIYYTSFDLILNYFTAFEQFTRKLPGTIEEGNFFIKRRNQCFVRKYTGDSDFSKTISAKLRGSPRG